MEYANELTTKFDSIIDATLTNYEAATARFDEAINLIRLAQDHAKQAGYDYYLSRLGYELKPEQYNKELTKNVGSSSSSVISNILIRQAKLLWLTPV